MGRIGGESSLSNRCGLDQAPPEVNGLDLKDFFAELKQRNVYKVAVAYAFVGWLAIQITATVFPILEIPRWAARVVVMLIAIGFPVALVLAWAFELTPEGIKRSDEVAPSKSKGRAWITRAVEAGLRPDQYRVGFGARPGR